MCGFVYKTVVGELRGGGELQNVGTIELS